MREETNEMHIQPSSYTMRDYLLSSISTIFGTLITCTKVIIRVELDELVHYMPKLLTNMMRQNNSLMLVTNLEGSLGRVPNTKSYNHLQVHDGYK